MPFRVLVLYLGNLYSLIIALLDRVNSMSAEVAPPWAAARPAPSVRLSVSRTTLGPSSLLSLCVVAPPLVVLSR